MRGASSGKIKHVVIIVQENRSFNNLFYGFPGAKTAKYGYDSSGKKIKLQPVGLETTWDIDHSSYAFFAACNGTGSIPGTNCRMNGFNKECVGLRQAAARSDQHPQYAYVPHSETKPYFDMGKQYVLGRPDVRVELRREQLHLASVHHRRPGRIGGQLSRQRRGAAPAARATRSRWSGRSGRSPTATRSCAGIRRRSATSSTTPSVSWAYYAVAYSSGSRGIWSAYQAIKHIYNGPDWKKDVITPPTHFLNDVSNGKLRAVSWVTPTCANSDHAGCGSNTGPSWVASLVNAIGESKYWDSTAIFIFWDDYGGWYDPEPPAYVDYDGLGLRLPMLVVSAYAKKGHVSHVHYEHGSILKFVEDKFGLGRLAASDTRANSPARRLLRLHAAAPKVRADSGALRSAPTSCISRPTTTS